MNVAVLGAGPAGLLAACGLSQAGYSVTVFEEHPRVGFPEHCTGIVRHDFFEAAGHPELEKLVLAGYTGGYVKAGEGGVHRFSAGVTKAVMMDRPGYEAALYEAASSSGVGFELKSRASVVPVKGGYGVAWPGSRRVFDLVVGARGPAANTSLRTIPGLQARVELDSRLEPDSVYVLFSRGIPGYFGWIAPYDAGAWAKVGLASYAGGLTGRLRTLFKAFGVSGRVKGYFGGRVVVGGAPVEVKRLNYVALGDEAGQVKPMTGGGLGLGMMGAKTLVSDLRRGDLTLADYRRWHRRLRGSLRLTEAMFRLILSTPCSIKDRMLEVASGSPATQMVLRESDFDDHSGVLWNLVREGAASLLSA
ncbi:MAG: NAD(P)/FAD-dependent oxidoreductase [Candidatus Marsarchaeota archaeon]|nr:NAD(P)/FAD-dependent oxidoreductase [Candidatus Marsarchaeota archaeon]